MTEVAIAFNEEGYGEYKQIAREVSRRVMNEKPHRGRWQQKEQGGGGQSIWFTIDEVLCPGVDDVEEETLVVTAEWYTGGCSKTPPGANYGGTYNVYGYCSGFNGLTPTELEGTKGKATYACPLSGYCEPRWLLDFLCGLPQC